MPKGAIVIPRDVWQGVEVVKRSGLTNMFDRPVVSRLARNMGFPVASEWIEAHHSEYAKGLFQGFTPAPIDWDNVQVGDFEPLGDTPTDMASDWEFTVTAADHELGFTYRGQSWLLLVTSPDFGVWETEVHQMGTRWPAVPSGLPGPFRDPWSALAATVEAIIRQATESYD